MNDVYKCFPLRGTLTSPELRNFANIFRRYYPAESFDSMSFYSMDGAIVIVEILERLGRGVTRERFMPGINKVKNFAGGAQPGTITYTPEDHRGMKFMNPIGLVRQREVIFQEYPAAPH
jgi:branched-chain amino acid transport system substrate-binding protein